MNVASLAVESIEKFGEFTATWFEDRQYTNLENYDRACRLASVLSSHGVGPDSRVVVMMLNSPDVLAAFLAIWKLGAVIIPVTPMWTAREVGYVLENSESGLVITSPELAPRVMDAALNVPSSPAIVTIGKSDVPGVTDISQEVDAAARFETIHDRQADDLALLLYTSGTTGNPKGVMLSHDNLYFAADSVYRNNLSIGQARVMQVLPLSHIYGILMMNFGFRLGTAGRILKHFDARKVLETIEELRVERLSFVPTMLTLLINQYRADGCKYDVSSLTDVNSGGAAMAEATRKEFSELFNCRVVQGYGMSESAGALSGYSPEDTYRVGSVGKAFPDMELCIMDDNLQQLPPGSVGEICARGRQVMLGYLKNPEATSATLIDGWLHSGDVGYMDSDGYIFITDRKKDLVIKGGENISPREIEEAIYARDEVSEVAVFGVPDTVYGENLYAAVVRKPGHDLSTEELMAHLGKVLTKFKLPANIIWLDTLPKGSTGKILKRALRDQYKDNA